MTQHLVRISTPNGSVTAQEIVNALSRGGHTYSGEEWWHAPIMREHLSNDVALTIVKYLESKGLVVVHDWHDYTEGVSENVQA
jgi:hypothetical protein